MIANDALDLRTIPVSESSRRIKLARACPHRASRPGGCHCIGWCALGKGKKGEVSLSECMDCVAEGGGARDPAP